MNKLTPAETDILADLLTVASNIYSIKYVPYSNIDNHFVSLIWTSRNSKTLLFMSAMLNRKTKEITYVLETKNERTNHNNLIEFFELVKATELLKEMNYGGDNHFSEAIN